MSVSKNDCGHFTFFLISNFLVLSSQKPIIKQLLFERVSLRSETIDNIFFRVDTVYDLHRHAASVRWRLSWRRWDVRPWHFPQQSCSSLWFSQGYCPELTEISCVFTACGSLCSHHQCVMSKGHSIQGHTLAQTLPNWLCHILKHSWVMCHQCQNWSQLLAGAPHWPLPTLCAGLNPTLQENRHRTQLTGHPKWRICKSQPVLLTAESLFRLGGMFNMCSMRWSADFVICVISFSKPTNLQQLIRDFMQVCIVVLHYFHVCVTGYTRQICSVLINAHDGRNALDTSFVISILAS